MDNEQSDIYNLMSIIYLLNIGKNKTNLRQNIKSTSF